MPRGYPKVPRPRRPLKGDIAVRRTGIREIAWTDIRSPWMDQTCTVEVRSGGIGGGWGRHPREAR